MFTNKLFAQKHVNKQAHIVKTNLAVLASAFLEKAITNLTAWCQLRTAKRKPRSTRCTFYLFKF